MKKKDREMIFKDGKMQIHQKILKYVKGTFWQENTNLKI